MSDSTPLSSASVSAADLVADWDLTGRIALVTGATSGIGARAAQVLAAVGAGVAVAGRRADRLKDVTSRLPGRASIHDVDLADDRTAKRLVSDVLDTHGRLDVVINNAGVSHPARAERESLESWHRVVALNLTAPFLISQAAATAMTDQKSGGAIVNVTSIVADRPAKRIPQASYTASKAALTGLTRELATQWGNAGIRVNAIAPGLIDTEMTAELLADQSSAHSLAATTALNRIGTVADIDHAVLLLSTPAGTFITGTVLTVDGGASAALR